MDPEDVDLEDVAAVGVVAAVVADAVVVVVEGDAVAVHEHYIPRLRICVCWHYYGLPDILMRWSSIYLDGDSMYTRIINLSFIRASH